MNDRLHTELWTSWASLLRSYGAAHGLNSTQQAVVEVSADEIIVRVGSHWLRFTRNELQHSGSPARPFALTEDGNVRIENNLPEEMDFAAEYLMRDLMASNP